VNAPFIVAGAFEAEQFDAGGIGIGYSNVVAHPTNYYRITGMLITNCNDLGGGYQLRLQSNEWARYTIKVQLAGNYVVGARARGANGGQIRFQFGNANGTANYQTAALALSGTGWQNLETTVTLTNGYNYVRVEGVKDASGYAADVNYITIYPSLPALSFPAAAITLGTGSYSGWIQGDPGTNFLTAQTNSGTLQAAINSLMNIGGGTVYFPTGRYYLAQSSACPPPWEELWAQAIHTFAIYLGHTDGPNSSFQKAHSLRLAGQVDSTTGTNLTTLIAHNRSVAMFLLSEPCCGQPATLATNISIENLTLKANPHIRTNGVFEPGWRQQWQYIATNTLGQNCVFVTYTNEYQILSDGVEGGVGRLMTLQGAKDVAIKHCGFVNGQTPLWLGNISSLLLQSNSFLMVNADAQTNILLPHILTSGVLTNKNPGFYPITNLDNVTWATPSPGPAVYSHEATNVLVLGNLYDGNPGHRPNTNGEAVLSDGFLFVTSFGGNWYLADNEITRFGLEGVFFYQGPNAAVRNRFSTIKEANLGAFVLGAEAPHTGISGDTWDLCNSIIGNSFVNVHVGVSAYDGTFLHYCGNYFSNSPPMFMSNVLWCTGNGGPVAMFYPFNFANISGNTVTNTGFAVSSYASRSGNSYFILANDFRSLYREDTWSFSSYAGAGAASAAPLRFDYYLSSWTSFTNVTIARNYIGSFADNPAHVGLNTADSLKMYLLQNTYLNTNGVATNVLVSPTDAPVHIY
jgi:hypothetical protein